MKRRKFKSQKKVDRANLTGDASNYRQRRRVKPTTKPKRLSKRLRPEDFNQPTPDQEPTDE